MALQAKIKKKFSGFTLDVEYADRLWQSFVIRKIFKLFWQNQKKNIKHFF